jgi:hypothetical protein
MTPRGHIVTTVLCLPVWLLVGLSVQRLARKRWRPQTVSNPFRFALFFLLALAPFGLLFLMMGVLSTFISEMGTAVRLVGLGLWSVWIGGLSSERLRVWPFQHIGL